MNKADLADCTASELIDLYRKKQASPLEATRAALARIERWNPILRAFSFVAADAALESARASEVRWSRGEPCGALDGVPQAPASARLRDCARRGRCSWVKPRRRNSAARARPTRL